MKNKPLENIDIVRIQMVRDSTLEYGRKAIRGPQDLAELGHKFIRNADREVFLLVSLNTRNHINCIHVVSIGTINTALVSPREVMKIAILSSAASIACVHNHPSGDPDPSTDDIQITNRIAECGKLFGIELIDHVIIADDGKYESFREKGLISKTVDPSPPEIREKDKTPFECRENRHETNRRGQAGEDDFGRQYWQVIGCKKDLRKEGKVPRKLPRLHEFTRLMEKTALGEMEDRPETRVPRKEDKDLWKAEMHLHFVLEDLVKKIIRFRTQRSEEDFVRLALGAYLLWMNFRPGQY